MRRRTKVPRVDTRMPLATTFEPNWISTRPHFVAAQNPLPRTVTSLPGGPLAGTTRILAEVDAA